ncbi:uncharacterized protein N7458_008708 [Penicillium daleae]|uniref:Yeast cell wall synthesis Kre9/Knh1-like N-terminal domain-containing protein n=1 Tax=Penicillium daleae TaxID=63821 RepID=A0AAD6G2E5_9EURO|nr:uncharacterized protein N7458_008708 [Penicillium daleae]KAJ5444836.1 hypothetical protein N7458_008708 [Penicillium daleae]
MMRLVIPLILSLASPVTSIQITSPSANSTYAAGSTITVKWTSVDTDPTNFSLYLWNFVSWPPSYLPLALNVPTSDLVYTVHIPCDTKPEWGYQISGINGTNVYIIYTQGDKFTVSEPANNTACVDPAPSLATSTCPSAAASTVYVTVSPTAPSSRLPPQSSHIRPSPPPSTTSTFTSRYVKPGIVPKTIGWCADYSHPVTLDNVPTLTLPVTNNGPRVKTITTTATVVVCPNVDAVE